MQNTNSKNSNNHFLAYLIPPVTSLVYYLSEKKDNHVRFHTAQSFVFGIIFLILFVFTGPFLAFLSIIIKPIVALVSLYFWIRLIWSSHNSKNYHLPYLGGILKFFINKKFRD